MMTVNDCLQIISILFRIGAIAFIGWRLSAMKYGFFVIVFRLLFRKDVVPIEWLRQNMLYVYFLVFGCTQFVFIMGLLHQFSLNQVTSKTWEFFAANPLSIMCIVLIIIEYEMREKRIRKSFK